MFREDMAAAEMRTAWQRTAATCYLLHEDSKRSTKSGGEALGAKQEEVEFAKGRKSELSEGWNTVNSHYFMDKKLDLYFHVENEGDTQTKSFLDVSIDSKSIQDWQTIDSPSVVESDGHKVVKASPTNPTNPSNVVCSLLDSKVQQPVTSRSVETVPGWRHANKGELAALIARKSSEGMANCDLPPPVSPAAKGVAGRVVKEEHSGIHRVVGNVLKDDKSALYGDDLTQAFRSLGYLDFKQKKDSVNSLELPHVKRDSASANQTEKSEETVNWKALEGDCELLGEALCRSQSRAREAEEKAAEAVAERDQLLKLFFREASVSLTYKHWVKCLQAENMWLRLRAKEEVEVEEEDEDQHVMAGELQRKRCKGQECGKTKKRRWENGSSSSAAVLGCTVGLAFALGVSLAGAGLVFGCTMGWILIAF